MLAMKVLFVFTICISAALAFIDIVDLAFLGYSFIPEPIFRGLGNAIDNCTVNSTEAEIRWQAVSDCIKDQLLTDQSICQILEGNLERCTQPFLDLYNDCISEKARDLPSALMRTIVSVVQTICRSTGEILLEITNPCVLDYNNTEQENCKEKILIKKFDNLVKDPTKSEACQTLTEIGDCWGQSINYNCPSKKTKEMFSAFYNAALAICK